MRARVEPLDRAAARALPVSRLTHAGARDARHGRSVDPRDIDASASATGAPSAWLDDRGALIAVGRLESDGRGKVLRGFGDESSSRG
jgi:hypothetical protein